MNEADYRKLLERAQKNLPQHEMKRFEIPQPISHVSGKNTALKNFAQIAKISRRNESHLAKYLAKELAVPNHREGADLVLQGKFQNAFIEKRIVDYFREFVICHECGKPDTSLQKDGRLTTMKCEACGARRNVKSV